jgi:arsenate reductase
MGDADDRIVLYHNPSCSKSRQASALLDDSGLAFETVRYLDRPLDERQLRDLLAILDDPPEKLVRKDGHFKELGLDAADYTEPDEVVALLVAHPRLMERPVVVRGGRAVIGRPTERVTELLS